MELQRKEEEMRQMFVNKVKETEAELKEKEKEVRVDIVIKTPFIQNIPFGMSDNETCPFINISSFMTGLSSSNGCTRTKRRTWRRKDENWRRR